MKNLLKLGLAVLGIVSATIASSTSVTAKVTKDSDSIAPVGGCLPTEYVCGVTAGGTTLKGSWAE